MAVVLWISRHRPLEAQIRELKEKLGEFEIIQHEKPLSTAEEAVELARKYKADYIIPVLPLSFIAHLVTEAKKYNFTVLRAEMENVHNCTQQPCPEYDSYTDTIMESKDYNTGEKIYRHFRFKEFVKLKAIEIVTEKW